MYEKLSAIGLYYSKSKGTFYLLPRLPTSINDDLEFAKLAQISVLVVPVSVFGAPGYIRVAYYHHLTKSIKFVT